MQTWETQSNPLLHGAPGMPLVQTWSTQNPLVQSRKGLAQGEPTDPSWHVPATQIWLVQSSMVAQGEPKAPSVHCMFTQKLLRQSNMLAQGEPTGPPWHMPFTQLPKGQSRGLLHGKPPDEELDVAADDELDVDPEDALEALDDDAPPPPEEADIPEELWPEDVALDAPAPLPLVALAALLSPEAAPAGNRVSTLEHAPTATPAEKANRAIQEGLSIGAMR